MITNIHYPSIKTPNQLPSFKSGITKSAPNLAFDTFEISSKKVPPKTGLVLGGILAGLLAKASKPKEITLNDVIISKESGDLESYKKNLIKFLENNYYDECKAEFDEFYGTNLQICSKKLNLFMIVLY